MRTIYAAITILVVGLILAAASHGFPIPNMLASGARIMSHDGIHIGSGVVLSDWIVLTNKHVATEDDLLVEFSTKDKRPGNVVWRSPNLDLAAIGVAVPETVTPAKLDCRAPVLGEPVAALGHPRNLRWVITQGHVASLERSHGAGGKPTDDDKVDIVLDLTINPGNSGGPVYDAVGRVIGIVYAFVIVPMQVPLPIPTGYGLMLPANVFCDQVLPVLASKS